MFDINYFNMTYFNMTKKIGFRAYDKSNKVMHYDFQFIKSGNEGNDWIIFTSDKQKLSDKHHPFENPYFQQQFQIMERSPFKDVSGKEIYEGDYVKLVNIPITNKNENYSEVFKDTFWQPFSYLDSYNFEFEVIGNKFEPEYPWNLIELSFKI